MNDSLDPSCGLQMGAIISCSRIKPHHYVAGDDNNYGMQMKRESPKREPVVLVNFDYGDTFSWIDIALAASGDNI